MKCISGLWAIAFFVLVWGCSSENTTNGQPGPGGPGGYAGTAGGGTAGAGGGTVAGGTGGYGPTAATGAAGQQQVLPPGVCEAQDFFPKPKQVAVMLLQDMSESMEANLDNRRKWDHAKDALTSMLTDPAYRDVGIQFGFDYFPDTAVNTNPITSERVYGCGVDDPVVVDANLNTEQQIIDWINSHEPDGATPLYCAINKFTNPNYAPGFYGSNLEKYLVVISDGADACGVDCASNNDFTRFATAADLQEVTNRLFNATPLENEVSGIRTIVIGFGSNVAPGQLEAIAKAGRVFDYYFNVNNATELRNAFEAIGSQVVSCIWEIDDPNATADPDKVQFLVDGVPVPHLEQPEQCETESGWVWGEGYNTVEFCNDACTSLRKGTETISAQFGCRPLG